MRYFNSFVRFLFWGIVVKFIVSIVLGINCRRQKLLPKKGPAIIIANHNSHLDTAVIINLYPLSMRKHLRPVAAAEYFLHNKYIKWFSMKIISIIPISRKITKGSSPLDACSKALSNNDIIILYPEGSRGVPENMGNLKSGITRLLKDHPNVPVTPIFLHGLGKALPKNDFLLVPFFCDIFVGKPISWQNDKQIFMKELQQSLTKLSVEYASTKKTFK